MNILKPTNEMKGQKWTIFCRPRQHNVAATVEADVATLVQINKLAASLPQQSCERNLSTEQPYCVPIHTCAPFARFHPLSNKCPSAGGGRKL